LPFGVKKNLIGLGQKVLGLKPCQHLIYFGSKVCSGMVGSGLSPYLPAGLGLAKVRLC